MKINVLGVVQRAIYEGVEYAFQEAGTNEEIQADPSKLPGFVSQCVLLSLAQVIKLEEDDELPMSEESNEETQDQV